MYISNRRNLFPLYYIYTDHLQCLQQSPIFVGIVYICCQHGLQVHSSKPGAICKKSLFTIKIWLPPPKNPIYTGMLRKTPIFPYIWWFLGAFRGYAPVWLRYGGIWVVLVVYGALWLYIWSLSIYRCPTIFFCIFYL